ncbi:hypothetical protein [Bacillus toyonensis]|uniref:hypothetical protein n=1 Tax=Bacillus toyonensis TaxID=155322 RepID=UPI00119E0F67|nr:hypothetical protein [Bacillus toyonensis]
MTDKYTNNSTTISGGEVKGNQFAAGSEGFRGTITTTSITGQEKIEELTNALIESLHNEKNIEDASPEEIIDAVNQVRDETKKPKFNKLSLEGIVAGINTVMTSVNGISATTKEVYDQWHEQISQLFQ